MTAQPRAKNPRPGKSEPTAAVVPPAPPPAITPGPGAVADAAVEKLTPEEQMERFAQELKNEDWGHQPC
jgi:hypothetical protein